MVANTKAQAKPAQKSAPKAAPKPAPKAQPKVVKPAAGAQKKKVKTLRFILDCKTVVDDEILDVNNFAQFLRDRIKVNGKTGALGDHVTISLVGDKKEKVHVVAREPFSKRYLKYLSKKYLKKNQMRDFLHVVATQKQTYEFRYFDIHDQDDEEEA